MTSRNEFVPEIAGWLYKILLFLLFTEQQSQGTLICEKRRTYPELVYTLIDLKDFVKELDNR